MTDRQFRFSILDGMRFVVALGVATFHFTLFAGIPVFQHGYLGVDFFFVLSGFIISFTYTARFAQGGFSREFLIRRFIRLYPMIALGSIFGFFLSVFDAIKVHDLLNSLLLIPEFDTFLFPVNVPIWSLFYEILVNILFALISIKLIDTRRSRTINYIWLTIFFICLIGNLFSVINTNSLDQGAVASTFIAGFPRAGQSFCAGVLLNRMSGSRPPISSKWVPLLIGLLIACMNIPFLGGQDGLFEFATVTFVFPAIVYYGSRISVSKSLAVVCDIAAISLIPYTSYISRFALSLRTTPMAQLGSYESGSR